jgi:hypothetical protein
MVRKRKKKRPTLENRVATMTRCRFTRFCKPWPF